MVTFTAVQWLQVLGLGAVAGALGQSARMLVGLKKLADEAAQRGTTVGAELAPSRLLVSILLGAVAGALAAITVGLDVQAVSVQQVVALAGAGYSGADFVEGFMMRAGTPTDATQTPPGGLLDATGEYAG
jgi:hypothetical protein